MLRAILVFGVDQGHDPAHCVKMLELMQWGRSGNFRRWIFHAQGHVRACEDPVRKSKSHSGLRRKILSLVTVGRFKRDGFRNEFGCYVGLIGMCCA